MLMELGRTGEACLDVCEWLMSGMVYRNHRARIFSWKMEKGLKGGWREGELFGHTRN